jgi:hypothetical protein
MQLRLIIILILATCAVLGQPPSGTGGPGGTGATIGGVPPGGTATGDLLIPPDGMFLFI